MLAANFRDASLEKQFNELGYAIVPDFLTKEIVEELYALYKDSHTAINPQQLQWNSLYELGYEGGLDLSAKISELILPIIEKTFSPVSFPVATFMSKNPVAGSTCEVHRDYTTLNETQFQFRNVWIPLVDITSNNGALYVVPGSHLLFNEIRPMFSSWPYDHLQKDLVKYFKILYPKAGDLIVYADRTLHGSELNRTGESRPVIHGGLLHPEAKLHYYKLNKNSNELSVFEVPYSFFFSNEFDDSDLESKYLLRKKYQFNPKIIRPEDLEKLVSNNKSNHATEVF
jgi:hypothetical protein